VVRPYLSYVLLHGRVARCACGSDFTPTPSYAKPEYSPTWSCMMNPQTTHPLASQISGREIVMENRCALERSGREIRSSYEKSKGYVVL
jgi:hypothetical protein